MTSSKKLNENNLLLDDLIESSSKTRDDGQYRGRRHQKMEEKRKESVENERIRQDRELNPNMRQSSASKSSTESSARKSYSTGDGGYSWLKKAYDRVYEQAEIQGRSAEEVAAERWGSLQKLKEMLDEAKQKNSASNYRDERRETKHRHFDRSTLFRKPDYERSDDRHRERSGHRSRHDTDHRRSRSEKNWRKDPKNENLESSFKKSIPSQEIDKPISNSINVVPVDSNEKIKSCSSNVETGDKCTDNRKNYAPASDEKIEKKILTKDEKNAIQSKILKAEMLGNEELAKQLRDKLQYYVANEKEIQDSTKAIEPENIKYINIKKRSSEEMMKMKQMFVQQKKSTTDDEVRLFVSNAKSVQRNVDDEYEGAVEKRKKKFDSEYEVVKEKKSHPSDCNMCLKKVHKQLILAASDTLYLVLPSTEPLLYGECFVRSIDHSSTSLTYCDEDCVREYNLFRSSLSQLYAAKNMTVIFMELYFRRKKANRHLNIHCIPVKNEYIDDARMYFKKAIMECDEEWSMNKKIVELNGKCVTRMLPKGLSYFWVCFGKENNGYAHVIEDEENFSNFFGQEVIGGLLDLEPRRWMKPKYQNYEQQFNEISQLKVEWKSVDPFLKSI